MKILPFKIPKTGNEVLIVQEDIEEIFYDRFHRHEEVQISCILKGSGTLLVGDAIRRYDPGDLMVLGSGLPHVFKTDVRVGVRSHMISIFFTKESFGPELFDINELKVLTMMFALADSGFKIKSPHKPIIGLFESIRVKQGIERFILFFQLLAFLSQAEKIPLSSSSYKTGLKDIEGERLGKVFDYMISHFQEQITLEDIADVASMTPTAFCRFFKTHTRKTFTQFLLELRLEHACKLLENNGHKPTVSDIAFQSGFNSVSNFNRYFRKNMGTSPLDYSKWKRKVL